MNASNFARYYGSLTPEERIQLMVAADDRGDLTELDRLAQSAQPLTLRTSDHAPYAHAFHELATLIFIELLELANLYLDALGRLNGAKCAAPHEIPVAERQSDLAFATGFVLKSEVDGWKRFCKGLNVPPFAVWKRLAGFDRLQRATKLTAQLAFLSEGAVRWLNRMRPVGKPELTEADLRSAESIADSLATALHQGIQHWGG